MPTLNTLAKTSGSLIAAAGVIFALDPSFITALAAFIVSVSSLGTLALGFLNWRLQKATHSTVATIEKNTNNKLDQLLEQRNVAATRADVAEGTLAGVKAEQDRTTKGT